jgi:deazaflavin-dependent oxidoreductase (nitroreductase family)
MSSGIDRYERGLSASVRPESGWIAPGMSTARPIRSGASSGPPRRGGRCPGSARAAWYHNLCANPRATICFEGVAREVLTQELEGDERERHYNRGIDIYPGWTQYRTRASHRRIPVMELTPVE